MAFAGMDVGTSGCKLLVYDLDGTVIFATGRTYREEGSGGHRELDPGRVLEMVQEILRDAGKNCPAEIEALAVTSLGESVVCLDENDRILENSMLTGDCRGIEETGEIIRRFGADFIFRTTGLPPNELYGLPKYMWLNRNTEAVRKAKAILFYEDFVGYYLTGRRVVSYSSAARSMAFDIGKKQWAEELLTMAGIKKEQMSEPAPSGTVIGKLRSDLAREFHLSPELKLVTGGHDQMCAALGSGLTEMSQGECGMGTCEFMFVMLPEMKMTPYMKENDFTCIPYAFEDTFLSSIEVTTCGALKNWAKSTLFESTVQQCEREDVNFFAFMDEKARDVRTEVLVLPQFGSSGNPDLSMDARGTITGLTIHTRPEEIYRGILEGFAFQMYLSYERMEKLGVRLETIAATGGGAASALTLQIRADVFGKKVLSMESSESGTLGCMVLAAAATGAYPSLEAGIRRAVKIRKEYVPDMEMHSYYRKKYQKYKDLYQKMYDFK